MSNETKKRKLIDTQYFQKEDLLIVHEIVDNEKVLTMTHKPKFSFAIAKEEIEIKREDFFIPVENVAFVPPVAFSNRHYEIAKQLGTYDMKVVKSLRGDELRNFKRDVMKNPRLFFADNSVTTHTSLLYHNNFKDSLDPSMKTKVLSFDIEVHNDFSYKLYKTLLQIMSIETELDLINFKMIDLTDNPLITNSLKMDNLNNYNNAMNKIFNFTPDEDKDVPFKDLVLAVQSKHMVLDHMEFIKNFLNHRMQNFFNNLGFPEQDKAHSRVDAISAYDNITKTMFLYLLMIPEDINPKFANWIIDKNLVEAELSLLLEGYKVKMFLNSHKTFKKNNIELFDEFIGVLDTYARFGDDISKSLLLDLIDKICEILPDVKEALDIKVEFKPYFNELEMIKAFFTDIRMKIKPNVLLAHNMFFDVITLYNRLYRYNENPDYWFAQIGYEDLNDDNEILATDFRIDYKAKNKKQDKSYVKVPGLIILDSLLLVAKTSQRERDFSLNAIAMDFLKESKFEFDAKDITELYTSNIRQFCVYSCLDTFLVDNINEKMDYVGLFQTLLNECRSCWSEYAMKSVFLTNVIKYYLLSEFKLITRNNIADILNDSDSDEKFEGAFVTSLEKVLTYGLHRYAFDVDATAMYPSCIINNGIMTDNLLLKFEDRDLYRTFLMISKISFAQKYMNGFTIEEIYSRL